MPEFVAFDFMCGLVQFSKVSMKDDICPLPLTLIQTDIGSDEFPVCVRYAGLREGESHGEDDGVQR